MITGDPEDLQAAVMSDSEVAAIIKGDEPWWKTFGKKLLDLPGKELDRRIAESTSEIEKARLEKAKIMKEEGVDSAMIEALTRAIPWAVGGTIVVVGIVAVIILMQRKRSRSRRR